MRLAIPMNPSFARRWPVNHTHNEVRQRIATSWTNLTPTPRIALNPRAGATSILVLGLNLSMQHFGQFIRWRLPTQSLPGSFIELLCNLP
jgi:hypothetical protein